MTEAGKGKIYMAVIVALLVVIGAMAYKFIVAGSTEAAADGRLAVVLAPPERALILKEMRDFVSGVQLISDALAREDMKAVGKAARAMGSAMSHDVPAPLIGKLPLEFKTLGFSVHADFDLMAMDAEGLGMIKHTLSQLSAILQKCVACHGSYQLKPAAAP